MIKYNCGCGFRTDNWVSAVHHVQATKHTMEAGGRIEFREVWEPEKEEVRDAKC